MPRRVLLLVAAAFATVSGLSFLGRPAAEARTTGDAAIEIPKSIKAEHDAIHAALVAATKAPGRVGAAATALADTLHPHFVREEQIALPPLGLLKRLAAGDDVSEAALSDAMTMTTALRQELPAMLEEHRRIRAAVEHLRVAAVSSRVPKYRRLAEQLALHAQTEEEVLYPAALLVGDVIRARRAALPR